MCFMNAFALYQLKIDCYRYRWIYIHTHKPHGNHKQKNYKKQKTTTKTANQKERPRKERKNYKSSQKTMNKCTAINKYFKCKWAKCANQKTEGGRVGKKTRPIYMLLIRDSLQIERHTQREGMEKDTLRKQKWKESWGSNIHRQIDFGTKECKKRQRRSLHNEKGVSTGGYNHCKCLCPQVHKAKINGQHKG